MNFRNKDPASQRSISRYSDAPVGMERWLKSTDEGCESARMVRLFKEGRDTTRPGGASDESSIEPSSTSRRDGVFARKSGSGVADTRCPEVWRSTNVVSLGILFHGKRGTTPDMFNTRNDDGSPPKRRLLRTGGGLQERFIVMFLRRGTGQEKCSVIS